MKMSKEGAASYLGLRIEGDGDHVKFVRYSGAEVTLEEAKLKIVQHQKSLTVFSKRAIGTVSSSNEWYHTKVLNYWVEIKDVLQKIEDEKELKAQVEAVPSVSPMPSLFDNKQFREIMTVVTSHQLFKKVDKSLDFGHSVNCITCGEMSAGTDQQFHIGHMLYNAGFRKPSETD